MINFKNVTNPSHMVKDSQGERVVWESRSVAVNCVVMVCLRDKKSIKDSYVLVSRRGPNAADFQGKLNLVAGYLDWNESGKEAVMRETWEECGLDLQSLMRDSLVLKNHMDQPWHVKTEPDENRQNISLRYGVFLHIGKNNLPTLSLKNNEIEGEVEEAWWMPISDILNHNWAFNHDRVTLDFLKLLH